MIDTNLIQNNMYYEGPYVNYHGLKPVACRQFSIYEPG